MNALGHVINTGERALREVRKIFGDVTDSGMFLPAAAGAAARGYFEPSTPGQGNDGYPKNDELVIPCIKYLCKEVLASL
jgi:hypothetical protein